MSSTQHPFYGFNKINCDGETSPLPCVKLIGSSGSTVAASANHIVRFGAIEMDDFKMAVFQPNGNYVPFINIQEAGYWRLNARITGDFSAANTAQIGIGVQRGPVFDSGGNPDFESTAIIIADAVVYNSTAQTSNVCVEDIIYLEKGSTIYVAVAPGGGAGTFTYSTSTSKVSFMAQMLSRDQLAVKRSTIF